jgi:hypothetical protein
MLNRILREGLRPNDLHDLVHNIFEIDLYSSKMGEDRDVAVLSFKVNDRSPATDMMEFIEKGYNFVLDADVSSGEDKNGKYHVFVELPRSKMLPRYIKEITDGIRHLTDIDNWKFRYYKKIHSMPFSEEKIIETVPTTPDAYDTMIEGIRVESIEKFFSSTYKEKIVVEGNRITIEKPFGIKLSFNLIEMVDDKNDLSKDLSETLKMDSRSQAEVMWLTKLLGDMNINKYGNSFVLENGKKAVKITMEI